MARIKTETQPATERSDFGSRRIPTMQITTRTTVGADSRQSSCIFENIFDKTPLTHRPRPDFAHGGSDPGRPSSETHLPDGCHPFDVHQESPRVSSAGQLTRLRSAKHRQMVEVGPAGPVVSSFAVDGPLSHLCLKGSPAVAHGVGRNTARTQPSSL